MQDALLDTKDGTIRKYDVLQIQRENVWLDFTSIRDQQEAVMAYRMVKGDCYYSNPVAEYRITIRGSGGGISKTGVWSN